MKADLSQKILIQALYLAGAIVSPLAFGGSDPTAATASGNMASPADASSATINLGQVSSTSAIESSRTKRGFEDHLLSKKQVFHSSQSVTSVDKQELKLFDPGTSGIQALTLKPGLRVSGYNATSGTARSTISMRGVKVGWNSVPGDLETNGVTALFDGVPLNSLIQGTGWHSVEIPLGDLLSGVNVIYGPGNPSTRWYDSIGGTVNFIPVQPTEHPTASVSAAYGSNQAQVFTGTASTGNHHGWSAVFATAYAHNNTYRTGVYNWPTRANQVFLKVRKKFQNGSFSIGGYWQRNDELRPNMIPTQPIPGVTVNGLNQNAPLYSQSTTGFYSDLPNNVWFKNNIIENHLVYSKLHLRLDPRVLLNNLTWYRHGYILHYRVNSGFPQNNPTGTEYYHPYSDTYGDKLAFDVKLPYNLLRVGGYFINSKTANRLELYNESLGTSRQAPYLINYNTFQNNYVSAFLEDHFSPVKPLVIVPGIQVVNYSTDFYNNNASQARQYPQAKFSTNPNLSNTFVRFAPSLGLTYQLLRWLSTYANYAKTYQNPTGGNFNNAQTDLPSLKPISSTDYELGVRILKNHWLGMRRIFLNVNYFHDLLAHETIPVSLASNPSVTTFGYGSATLSGVNAEIKGDLNNHWSAFTNASWLHGYYNQYFSTTDNQTYDGYPVSDSPNVTLSAGGEFKTYLDEMLLRARLWDQYFGHSYLFNNLTGAPSNQTIPSYNLVNMSLSMKTLALNSYVPGLEDTRLALYLTNLLNSEYNSTEYISAGGYFGGNSAGAVLANPGAPRAVFITASLKF